MKKTLFLAVSVFILGVGMAIAGYRFTCALPANSDDSESTAKRSFMDPVEVVHDYVIRCASCGVLTLDDLTQPIPDKYMYLLFDADENYLEKQYNSTGGLISLADDARPIYRKFINKEFPSFICQNKFSLGKLLNVSIDGDLATVTADLVMPGGTFDSAWTFALLRNNRGWHVFYLGDPNSDEIDSYRHHPKLAGKGATETTTKQQKTNGTKFRFRDRP